MPDGHDGAANPSEDLSVSLNESSRDVLLVGKDGLHGLGAEELAHTLEGKDGGGLVDGRSEPSWVNLGKIGSVGGGEGNAAAALRSDEASKDGSVTLAEDTSVGVDCEQSCAC